MTRTLAHRCLLLALYMTLGAQAHGQSLIAFCAEWCGPCKQMEPILAEVERSGVDIQHVDADQNRQMMQLYKVTSVPTLIAVDNAGKERSRLVGAQTKDSIFKLLGNASDWRASSAPPASQGITWQKYTPPGSVDGRGLLQEVLSRCTPQGRQTAYTPGEDEVNYCHEATHQLNSRIRNEVGSGVNAFFVGKGEGLCIVLKEPRVTLATVRQYVQPNMLAGFDQIHTWQQWNDQPLYVIDEWTSYCNGSQAAKEHGRNGQSSYDRMQWGSHYADALVAAIQRHDPSYQDMDRLVAFIAWQKQRIANMLGGGMVAQVNSHGGTGGYRPPPVQRPPQVIQGERGPRGPRGKPGPVAEIDYEQLAAHIDLTQINIDYSKIDIDYERLAILIAKHLPSQPIPPAEQVGPAYYDIVPRKK